MSTRTPLRTLGFLGLLYSVQFIGLGFLNAIGTVLRSRGVGLEELAMLQAIGMVWGAKLLWAPLLDRYSLGRLGYHRGWLILLQGGMVLSLLAMGTLARPEQNMGLLALLVLVFSILSASQDIATDAVAARSLASGRRGIANGVQQAGGYLGTLLGGGLTVLVYQAAGWRVTLVFVAAMVAVPLIAVLRYREPQRDVKPSSLASAYLSMISLARQPGALLWMLLVMPVYLTGSGSLAYVVIGPALIDGGATPAAVALTTTVLVAVPAMAVALTAGWGIGRWGRLPVTVLGTVLTAFALVLVLPLLSGEEIGPWSFAAYVLYGALQTIPGTVMYTVSMDYSRAATAGSDVTTVMALPSIISMGSAAGGLALAASIGYAGVGWVAIGLTLLGGDLTVMHLRRYGAFLVAQADRAAAATQETADHPAA